MIVSENYQDLSRQAASHLVKKLAESRRVNIGLPTGNTPTGMYGFLVQYVQLGLPIDHIHFYNIDEYCGVDGTENGTCARYLQDHFYKKAPISKSNIHLLTEETYSQLDRELEESGGLDAVILGIGENGHIAYNEPGTAFNTNTHILSLTHESKLQHGEEFGGYDHVPDAAVTMGIKTIMKAKHVILMANGVKKAGILKASLTGPVSEEIPSSILQLHPNIIVFADKEAAEKL